MDRAITDGAVQSARWQWLQRLQESGGESSKWEFLYHRIGLLC
jgi:hypothetical protein